MADITFFIASGQEGCGSRSVQSDLFPGVEDFRPGRRIDLVAAARAFLPRHPLGFSAHHFLEEYFRAWSSRTQAPTTARYAHQTEDIVRLTPAELKRKMAETEAAAKRGRAKP